MLHKDVLKLLTPLDLGGVSDADHGIEGAVLDAVQARIDDLGAEMFADMADELLAAWEALFVLTPPAGATIESRRAAVVGKLRATGDIKKPYFVLLAASMGYSIRIEDYTPTMAAWQCAGDELLEEPWSYFTAGCAMAGDYLAQEDPVLPWIWEVVVTAVPAPLPSPGLEEVLNDLKPAHIKLNFTYL